MGKKFRQIDDLANERTPDPEIRKMRRSVNDYESRKRTERQIERRRKKRGH